MIFYVKTVLSGLLEKKVVSQLLLFIKITWSNNLLLLFIYLQGNTILETYINYLLNWLIIAQHKNIDIYTSLRMKTIKTANNKI